MTTSADEAGIRAPLVLALPASEGGAQLDSAHRGDIRGGITTIVNAEDELLQRDPANDQDATVAKWRASRSA